LTEIALRPTNNGAVAVPQQSAAIATLADWATEMDAAHRIAKVLCTTSFVPKDFRNKPDEITAAILTGAAMGLPPTTALQIMTVIQGRVGMYAKGQVAILRSHGHDVWTEERTDQSVTVAGRRKEWPEGRITRITITMDQAKQAGWTSNNTYAKTPQDMLYARCATRVCGEVAPELLYGIPVVEELADLPPLQVEATVAPRVTAAEILNQSAPSTVDSEATAPVLVTQAQTARMRELFTEQGVTNPQAALARIAAITGRSCPWVEITAEEADLVIAALETAHEKPEPISVPQRNHIMALAPELGLSDRDLRLLYISDLLGREVASTNDLTHAQAHKVIDRMLAAKAAQEEAGTAPDKTLRETQKEQATQLRRTRGAAGDGA
jgi:hypothetical protein